jgi:uncharacterized protein YwqG
MSLLQHSISPLKELPANGILFTLYASHDEIIGLHGSDTLSGTHMRFTWPLLTDVDCDGELDAGFPFEGEFSHCWVRFV